MTIRFNNENMNYKIQTFYPMFFKFYVVLFYIL